MTVRTVLTTIVCVFLSLGEPVPATRLDSNSRDPVPALLSRFESIFHASAELLLSGDKNHELNKQDFSLLRSPFDELFGEFHPDRSATLRYILANSESVTIGARDFRSPVGVGAVRYNFCMVITLKRGSSLDLEEVLGAPDESLNGLRVWRRVTRPRQSNPERGPNYFAQANPPFILFSNSLEELRKIAPPTSLRGTLSEDAKRVEDLRQFPIWGYRRYRHDGVKDRLAAGMTDVTSQAQFLEFFANLRSKECVMRLHASVADPSATQINNRRPRDTSTPYPMFNSAGSGIWEARFPLSGDQTSLGGIFTVLLLFGVGLYP